MYSIFCFKNLWADIETPISIFVIELSTKIVDRLLITSLISMMPTLNVGVEEMGFVFCNLHVSPK